MEKKVEINYFFGTLSSTTSHKPSLAMIRYLSSDVILILLTYGSLETPYLETLKLDEKLSPQPFFCYLAFNV